MKKMLQVVLCALVMQAHAAAVVDVYGLDTEESATLLTRYSERVKAIMIPLNQAGRAYKAGDTLPAPILHLVQQKKALVEEIKQKEGYLYVNFEEVLYSDRADDHFITLDVVKPSQSWRLKFMHNESEKIDPIKPTTGHDVVDDMHDYTQKSAHLFLNNQLDARTVHCPVYHCFMGFEHPQLRPYLALFNRSAIVQKAWIKQVLDHDPSPARRAMAAFLVGHFRRTDDIFKTLLPHVNDTDETVRNNTIRVIAATLAKSKNRDLDVHPFLALLASPSLTDRNKSLFVLAELSQDKTAKKVLIRDGATRLLAMYAMKQPNHHGPAYFILKQLSGQDFGDSNPAAWRDWFKHASSAKG